MNSGEKEIRNWVGKVLPEIKPVVLELARVLGQVLVVAGLSYLVNLYHVQGRNGQNNSEPVDQEGELRKFIEGLSK